MEFWLLGKWLVHILCTSRSCLPTRYLELIKVFIDPVKIFQSYSLKKCSLGVNWNNLQMYWIVFTKTFFFSLLDSSQDLGTIFGGYWLFWDWSVCFSYERCLTLYKILNFSLGQRERMTLSLEVRALCWEGDTSAPVTIYINWNSFNLSHWRRDWKLGTLLLQVSALTTRL